MCIRDRTNTNGVISWEISSDGAPTDAHYLTNQSEAGLSNEVNLGALSTGLLKITVAAGEATPSVITDNSTIWNLSNEIINYADSPMIVSGGAVTEGTNAGTIKVAALTALLRSTNSETGDLVKVTKTEEDNISIPAADTTYFISLNYNGGSPTISLVTSNPYDSDKRNIPIGKARKDASDNVYYVNGGYRFQDGIKKLHSRARTLRKFELDGGSTIAYKADNYFTMSTGIVYGGINTFDLSAYDSSTETFIPVSSNGSNFVYGTARNTIDYEHYDAQDGTLGNVGTAKYGCHWVYKLIDMEKVYVRYGIGSYSLAEAEATKEPPRPDFLTDFGCLIGRIIAPQAGGSFAAIDMVTDRFFVGTKVGDHAALGSLQGGTTDEYYHLTATQHTIATQAATTSVSGYLSNTDWNTFNDKMDNPMTAQGDIIFGGASGTPTRLPKGVAGQVLTMNAGATAPEWSSVASSANTSLSNLSTVAINTSLIPGADGSVNLGTGDLRFKDIWAQTLSSGLTPGDTLKLRARNINTSTYTDILVITSNDTVTADLNSLVTIGGNAILYSGGDAGTPSALVGTNITGTALGLTAGAVIGFTPASGSLTLAGAHALTLTTTDTTNVTLPTSGTLLANVSEDTTPKLGGNLDAQDKNITGLGSVGFTQELDNGTKSANFSIDFSTDQKQKVTLTANTMILTLDTTNVKPGNYILKIVNGGLATLTWASETGNVYFPGGTDPSLTSSGTDIIACYFDGTDWYLVASLNFS